MISGSPTGLFFGKQELIQIKFFSGYAVVMNLVRQLSCIFQVDWVLTSLLHMLLKQNMTLF